MMRAFDQIANQNGANRTSLSVLYPIFSASDPLYPQGFASDISRPFSIVDPFSPVELAREHAWRTFLLSHIKSLSPRAFFLPQNATILDLACGPGNLLLDLAATYPRCRCFGLDLHENVLQYAKARLQAEKRRNVELLLHDIHHPLPEGYRPFRRIFGHFLASILSPTQYQEMLKRSKDSLARDGAIHLVECREAYLSLETLGVLSAIYRHALAQEHLFEAEHLAANRWAQPECGLAKLLLLAGYTRVQTQSYHVPLFQEQRCSGYLWSTSHQLISFLRKAEILNTEEEQILSAQIQQEILQGTFHGYALIEVAVGSGS